MALTPCSMHDGVDAGPVVACVVPEAMPLPPPRGTTWCTLRTEREEDVQAMTTFLCRHYVQAQDTGHRLCYSPAQLRWLLGCGDAASADGAIVVGLREQQEEGGGEEQKVSNDEALHEDGGGVQLAPPLVGMIVALPLLLRLPRGASSSSSSSSTRCSGGGGGGGGGSRSTSSKDCSRVYVTERPGAIVTLLAVHEKVRGRGWGPQLMQEMRRRLWHRGLWQMAFTGSTPLPVPAAATAVLYGRALSPLLAGQEAEGCVPHTTVASCEPELPPGYKVRQLRATEQDVRAVAALLRADADEGGVQAGVAWTPALVRTMLLPRERAVQTLVVVNKEDVPMDVTAFYMLCIQGVPPLRGAVVLHATARTMSRQNMLRMAVSAAREAGADVLQVAAAGGIAAEDCVAAGCTAAVASASDAGCLRYYLFNWRAPRLDAAAVALPML